MYHIKRANSFDVISIVVAVLFIMPTGVWPSRKCKEWNHWGLKGTVAIGKQVPSLKGGAAATSQFYLLVAIGAPEPRVTSQDFSTEARNWHLM